MESAVMHAAADRFRIASVQWDMARPSEADAFFERVEFFIATAAADYRADVVLFPEYFTLPLAALDEETDAPASIRKLAARTDEVNARLAGLAVTHRTWVVAGSQPVVRGAMLTNEAFVFGPDGEAFTQPKLHITPWERQAWGVVGGDALEVIDFGKVKAGVQICYDVEFPEPTRKLADAGMELLLVPYCTDDRRGHLRVTRCAMARAVENQIAVATAGCTGILRGVPAANVHHARSGVFTPVDLGFPWDGIAARAVECREELLIGEIDLTALRASRGEGTVTPLKDRRRDLFG